MWMPVPLSKAGHLCMFVSSKWAWNTNTNTKYKYKYKYKLFIYPRHKIYKQLGESTDQKWTGHASKHIVKQHRQHNNRRRQKNGLSSNNNPLLNKWHYSYECIHSTHPKTKITSNFITRQIWAYINRVAGCLLRRVIIKTRPVLQMYKTTTPVCNITY